MLQNSFRIERLGRGDLAAAQELFRLLPEIFEEPGGTLSASYIEQLLARSEFWAVAAFDAGRMVGGLSAHTLPLTRMQGSEVFIYDIAVHPEWRRRGVGRRLVHFLRERARAAGIETMFVAADAADGEAIAFYRALDGAELPAAHFTFGGPTGG